MRMGGADMAIELSDEDIASDDIVEEDIERMDQRYASNSHPCAYRWLKTLTGCMTS